MNILNNFMLKVQNINMSFFASTVVQLLILLTLTNINHFSLTHVLIFKKYILLFIFLKEVYNNLKNMFYSLKMFFLSRK